MCGWIRRRGSGDFGGGQGTDSRGKKKPLAVSGYTFTKDGEGAHLYQHRRVWRVHSRGLPTGPAASCISSAVRRRRRRRCVCQVLAGGRQRVAYVRDKNVTMATGRIEVLTKRSATR